MGPPPNSWANGQVNGQKNSPPADLVLCCQDDIETDDSHWQQAVAAGKEKSKARFEERTWAHDPYQLNLPQSVSVSHTITRTLGFVNTG
jgi:hypothetical protein